MVATPATVFMFFRRADYVAVISRMALWKVRPRTWTKKLMVLPARFRCGQRQ
jgi:hypothetical protein